MAGANTKMKLNRTVALFPYHMSQGLVSTLRFALVIALCLYLLGCAGEEVESGVPSMEFTLDPEQLGPPVLLAAEGIRFRAPAGWKPLNAGEVDRLDGTTTDTLGAGPDSLLLRPLHIFMDDEAGSVLSVSYLRFHKDAPFSEQIKRYGTTLAKRFSQDSVRQTQFMKNDLHMAQYLLQPQGLVNFKVVFEAKHGALLQFDYVVPAVHYPEEVRAVESSIGSIVRTP